MENDGTGKDAEEQSESLGAKVTPELKQQVRVLAAHRGMSMSEYVRTAVKDAVEEDLDDENFRSMVPAAD